MKKYIHIYIIAILAVCAGCSREKLQVPGQEGGTPSVRIPSGFTASLPTAGNKTAVNMGTGVVTWLTDDPILVATSSDQLVMYVEEGGSTSAALYAEEEVPEGASYYAVYPAGNASVNSGIFNSVIPGRQTYTPGGFASQTFPMVAIADGRRNFAFRNAASLLRLDLSGSFLEGQSISSVTLSASEPMTGAISVNYTLGNDPEVSVIEGVGTVTVTGPNDGIPFGEPIYAVVAPGNYTNLHIRLEMASGLVYESDVDGSYSVYRSAYRIVPVEVEDNFADLSDPEPANCYLITNPGSYKFRIDRKGNAVATSAALETAITGVSGLTVYHRDGSNFVDGGFVMIGNYIYFSTLTSAAEDNSLPRGTALLSVTSEGEGEEAEDKVLWSWHVWSNGRVKDVTLSNGSTWLNMNLGAHQVGFNSEGYNGYYYQWGRKDPFIQKYTRDTQPATLAPFVSHASKVDGSLENSIANPNVFYGGYHPSEVDIATEDWSTYEDAVKVYDWWNGNITGDSQTGQTAAKTMFDPCPPGYRVPSYSEISALLDCANSDGRAVPNAWWVEDVLYFPYTSYRFINISASNWQSGNDPTAYIPCSMPAETNGKDHRRYAVLRLHRDSSAEISYDIARSHGVPVRCIKAGSAEPDDTIGMNGNIENMEPDTWE